MSGCFEHTIVDHRQYHNRKSKIDKQRQFYYICGKSRKVAFCNRTLFSVLDFIILFSFEASSEGVKIKVLKVFMIGLERSFSLPSYFPSVKTVRARC